MDFFCLAYATSPRRLAYSLRCIVFSEEKGYAHTPVITRSPKHIVIQRTSLNVILIYLEKNAIRATDAQVRLKSSAKLPRNCHTQPAVNDYLVLGSQRITSRRHVAQRGTHNPRDTYPTHQFGVSSDVFVVVHRPADADVH